MIIYFAGSVCRVYQWFEELSDKDDALLLFQGIAKQPSFNLSEVRFDIEENSDVFIDLPTTIITKNSYPDAPDESIGMPLPIVYGNDWDFRLYATESTVVSPCICVDNNLKTYYAACHKIKQANTGTNGDDIKIYLEDAKRYGYIYAANISYTNDSNGARFTLNDDVYFNLFMMPRIKGGQYNAAATDYSNAIDGSSLTSLSLTSEEKVFLKLDRLPSKGLLEFGDIDLNVITVNRAGTSPYGEVKCRNDNWDAGNGAWSPVANITAGWTILDLKANKTDFHGQRGDQEDEDDPWTFDELGAIEYGLEVGNGDSLDLEEIFVTVTKIPLIYTKFPRQARRKRRS